MKNVLFLFLLSLASMGCNKDGDNGLLQNQATPEIAQDRGPNCAIVEVRVDLPYLFFSELHDFQIFMQSTSLQWHGILGSSECGGQNIVPGAWYRIEMAHHVQYEMRYTYKRPCTQLAAGNASFSIRTGGEYVSTFPLSTGNTPATNPDVVYFYRSGCLVAEGVIE